MDKQIKAKWIKALESGRYAQGEGQLHRDGTYCCLGVLRALMHKGSKDSEGGDNTFLSKKHQKEAGLTMRQQCRLVTLNDDKGYTFKEIAGWIKKYL